tara:strand:- start:2208 stop:2756 length:549 start_codon:yes stop_codon:yes gene_type:complete
MALTIADTYYLKAKSAAGYDWDEVCESLNYALSYDENHCAALCLLGKIYAGNLNQYSEAFDCFDKVIAINNTYIDVYPIYAKYLILADEIEKATKLIEFAFTIKGISKGSLFWLSAYAAEIKENYKAGLIHLEKAKKHAFNDDYYSFIEDEENRIKKKLKLNKSKVKKKKTSSKKRRKKKKN